jgi:hypothetical protein
MYANLSQTSQKALCKPLVICLLMFFFASHAALADTKKPRILFIGNSLTSANNLPKLVEQIAKFKQQA